MKSKWNGLFFQKGVMFQMFVPLCSHTKPAATKNPGKERCRRCRMQPNTVNNLKQQTIKTTYDVLPLLRATILCKELNYNLHPTCFRLKP